MSYWSTLEGAPKRLYLKYAAVYFDSLYQCCYCFIICFSCSFMENIICKQQYINYPKHKNN